MRLDLNFESAHELQDALRTLLSVGRENARPTAENVSEGNPEGYFGVVVEDVPNSQFDAVRLELSDFVDVVKLLQVAVKAGMYVTVFPLVCEEEDDDDD